MKVESKKKTPKWFYLVMILIPIVVIVLLELSLRLFNYGKDIPQWVDAQRGKYIINPEVAYRYFNQVKNIPTTIEDVFDQQKKPNAFRVFVLGESSAAGFPYMPMGSFSRYIRKRLELNYPNNTIEVVNISLSAINTYTLLDLLPEVLTQKPDLILIYTGHNEYYGALGVGSMESLGTSRTFVKLILHLNKYKTVQLIRNVLSSVLSAFKNESVNDEPGTLMSRMAQDQYIDFNSDKYNLGLEQFEDNMRDILQMTQAHNVPVIIGELVSNLKDQKPFISIPTENYPTANQVFIEANKQYENGFYNQADSLYRLAKDLDGLRFRASEKVNQIIKKLSKDFNIKYVKTDSVFCAESPNGIVGDNLMTDHLHPNMEGYLLMGEAYYEAMIEKNILPKNQKTILPSAVQDSLTRANFVFSDLDSLIGNSRILLLKNDWPFIDKSQKKSRDVLFQPKNYLDSINLQVVINNKLSWANAHLTIGEHYLKQNNISKFLKHMDVLIYQYPIVVEYYDRTSLILIQKQLYDFALKYLSARYNIEPSDYSAKWMGNIALFKGDIDGAINYLNKSIQLNSKDAQIFYNLAGAYIKKKDYNSALNNINSCLALNPNYPNANNLRLQLIQAEKNIK
jgi:tetratricopeptide (TPR) repeat protein